MKKISIVLLFVLLWSRGYPNSLLIADSLLTKDKFLGITVGETDFKTAGEVLSGISYKEPKLLFKSIRWRDGGCSILLTHHYFVNLNGWKLHVVLYGYSHVGRIEISSYGKTRLAYKKMILGRSRIGNIEFTGDQWQTSHGFNGRQYLTRDFNGITVYVPGDSLELYHKNFFKKKINMISLTKH